MADLLEPTTLTALSRDDIRAFQEAFESSPSNRAAMNAVCTTSVTKVALNRKTAAQLDHTFSIHLPENPATSQNRSGRCWMFAALNTFRSKAQKVMNITEHFELSQNYTMFWDKLEKSNYFLSNIISTVNEPVGSRLLDFLLCAPIGDGGQWHMFVNLIDKYGIVPKTVMPETESSSETGRMNSFVTAKLRDYACELRRAAASGSTTAELDSMRVAFMSEVYRMLCIHLGEPPTSFEWQWRDKDREFHRTGEITPQEFYQQFVGIDLDRMVCLINDPRPGHDFNRTFTVKMLGNMVGGDLVEYLNVDIETIKQSAIKQLESGEPVWFGCDVGQYLERDMGVMDRDLFDYDLVYGISQTMTKAERLQYNQSLMTHAMVFTGVDVSAEGKSRRWRVENSWSEKPGDKGFFQMSDRWFDEFTYEVVVDRSFVPEEALKAFDSQPIELDPWDPMGSLAS